MNRQLSGSRGILKPNQKSYLMICSKELSARSWERESLHFSGEFIKIFSRIVRPIQIDSKRSKSGGFEKPKPLTLPLQLPQRRLSALIPSSLQFLPLFRLLLEWQLFLEWQEPPPLCPRARIAKIARPHRGFDCF